MQYPCVSVVRLCIIVRRDSLAGVLLMGNRPHRSIFIYYIYLNASLAYVVYHLIDHVASSTVLFNHPTFTASTEFANTAIHPDTGESVEYKALQNSLTGSLWVDGTANKIGRLASGNLASGMTDLRDGDHPFSKIPRGKKATYLKVVVADIPNKAIKQRVFHRWW